PAVPRRPVRPRGGRGDGQAGGNGPRIAVPGDRRDAASARGRGARDPQDGRLHRAPEGQLMDDEMLELTSRSDAEVVRRIEAFGDLRLSPSLAARARMRSAIMDAAQERSTAMAAEAAATTARVAVAPLERTRRPSWRRP